MRFQLEVSFRCDFADVFEVKIEPYRAPRSDHHRLVGAPAAGSYRLFEPGFSSRRDHGGGTGFQQSRYANGRLSFEVALQPGAAWHACLLYTLEDGEQPFRAAARLRRSQLQIAPRRDVGAMAEERRQDRDQQ